MTKERLAIVGITLLLLWGWGFTWPHIAAAAVGIPFFCWFVGRRRVSRRPTSPDAR